MDWVRGSIRGAVDVDCIARGAGLRAADEGARAGAPFFPGALADDLGCCCVAVEVFEPLCPGDRGTQGGNSCRQEDALHESGSPGGRQGVVPQGCDNGWSHRCEVAHPSDRSHRGRDGQRGAVPVSADRKALDHSPIWPETGKRRRNSGIPVQWRICGAAPGYQHVTGHSCAARPCLADTGARARDAACAANCRRAAPACIRLRARHRELRA